MIRPLLAGLTLGAIAGAALAAWVRSLGDACLGEDVGE